jgi:hypothetical protein
MDWGAVASSSELLAFVAPKSLPPQIAWPHTLGLGWISPHWHTLVPQAHPASQLQRPLANSAFVLGAVAKESLLPRQQMVLGKEEANWLSSVPPAHFQTLGWWPMARHSTILASHPS